MRPDDSDPIKSNRNLDEGEKMSDNKSVFVLLRISRPTAAFNFNPEGPYALVGVVGPSFFTEGT
jgi:hypothetical protein